MDKAGITVSASHNQMMMMTTMAAASTSEATHGLNASGQLQQILPLPDDNDTIAATCQLIVQKGFQPLENVIDMEKW